MRFTAERERGAGDTAGLQVLEAVVAALGSGKRPKVTVTSNG